MSDPNFWLAIGCLSAGILLGISLAVHNARDEEGRKDRLEKRKAQRKARRRPWVWPR
jgi:hypothetical protein